MIIAQKLRETNRAEYLLYMWQVEDLVRVYGLDADRIATEYVARFELDETTRKATEQWYADICQMMREEGLTQQGHLQICKNTLSALEELHQNLLGSEKFPYYRQMYYKVLPYIVELRSKSPDPDKQPSELETCFNALYGVMMLRLQKKDISPETAAAIKDIGTLTGQLSDYFNRDSKEPIEF